MGYNRNKPIANTIKDEESAPRKKEGEVKSIAKADKKTKKSN